MSQTLTKKRHNQYGITCGKYTLPVRQHTLVMGVLNRTPDSFSDGGMFQDFDSALRHAQKMSREGADIIDIGGESTRPGAEPATFDEEIERVIPLIKVLTEKLKIPVSIDTSKSVVAEEALKSGASIVNDVTGLKKDPLMAGVAAKYNAAVIVMHMKGTPRNMQLKPEYKDLIGEITEGLRESVEIAKNAGIDEDKIIVDPGIGFGKTVEHNLRIIKELYRFKVLARPILIGVSRKSFIGHVLDLEVENRLMGSAASAALAIANGADIIRVHDVALMRQVAGMIDAIIKSTTPKEQES